MTTPQPRPRSLPLRLAKWLGIAWAVSFFTLLLGALIVQLIESNAGSVYGQPATPSWARIIAAPFMLILPLSFSVFPVVLAALLIWHWASAMLAEQRRIRRALDRMAATIDRQHEHH